jgi:hypothetical protein
MNDSRDDLVNWDVTPRDDQRRTSGDQQPVSEEVVWGNVEQSFDQESDVELEPLDPQVERNRLAIRESFLTVGVVYDEEEDSSRKKQFSIRDILMLNTVLAVLLALMQWLAPSLLAGTLGITTMLAAILIAIYEPETRRVALAWWCMLFLYIAACIFALYR